ncbi:hypothetical protein BD779DRAFT_1475085 [Infundibulicybe gibba]|nr:hypothetical protein BD779DRAFT_1475085 [Infundibulicybe gibba]
MAHKHQPEDEVNSHRSFPTSPCVFSLQTEAAILGPRPRHAPKFPPRVTDRAQCTVAGAGGWYGSEALKKMLKEGRRMLEEARIKRLHAEAKERARDNSRLYVKKKPRDEALRATRADRTISWVRQQTPPRGLACSQEQETPEFGPLLFHRFWTQQTPVATHYSQCRRRRRPQRGGQGLKWAIRGVDEKWNMADRGVDGWGWK